MDDEKRTLRTAEFVDDVMFAQTGHILKMTYNVAVKYDLFCVWYFKQRSLHLFHLILYDIIEHNSTELN